jgi:prepilin-type N-terminal cleavage/methylation domain-containing protein
MKRQAGFTLVELLVAFVILALALALTAQLLQEGQLALVDTTREQTEAPITLVLARIRNDVLSAAAFYVVPGSGGARLTLLGHPAGTVIWEREGDQLVRGVNGAPGAPVLRNVTGWAAASFSAGVTSAPVVSVEIHYNAPSVRRRRLVTEAVQGTGPGWEERSESLLLLPRGGGRRERAW